MPTAKGLVGTTGEYYVCAELCKLNILALMAPRNNPLFDVVATSVDGKRSVVIQVKTKALTNRQGWKLAPGITRGLNNPNLFVILVDLKKEGPNDYYVYEHDVLSERVRHVYRDYMRTPTRQGGEKKKVGFRWFDFKHFNANDRSRCNAWQLLGL